MIRSRLSIRFLAVAATAVSLSAASVTAASAAPRAGRTTTSAGTITLKLSNVKPHAFHTLTESGTVPSWVETVTLQSRVVGTSTWHTIDKLTPSKGKYKDTVEFGFSDVQIRATAGAVGKHKALTTKTILVKPQHSVLYSGTTVGLGHTPAVHTGDEAYVSGSFTCPTGTPAHGFALATVIDGQADAVVDDDADAISGSGGAFFEADSGGLFAVEAIGASNCTWTVTIEG